MKEKRSAKLFIVLLLLVSTICYLGVTTILEAMDRGSDVSLFGVGELIGMLTVFIAGAITMRFEGRWL